MLQTWDLERREQQYCDTINHNPGRLQFDLYQSQIQVGKHFFFYTRHHNNFSPSNNIQMQYAHEKSAETLLKHIEGSLPPPIFHEYIEKLFLRVNFMCVACSFLGAPIWMSSSIFSQKCSWRTKYKLKMKRVSILISQWSKKLRFVCKLYTNLHCFVRFVWS